jgi:hypothetical protein
VEKTCKSGVGRNKEERRVVAGLCPGLIYFCLIGRKKGLGGLKACRTCSWILDLVSDLLPSRGHQIA